MALTASRMTELGSQAPDFALKDTKGQTHSLYALKDHKAYLVLFICNHCPYVKHVRSELAAIAREYWPMGLGVFGINSNDADAYPDDSPEAMAREVEEAGYIFPYLYDEDQSVAARYGAACTPDIFLYDSEKRLVYRGQLDDSRPGNGIPVTGKDLRAAIDALMAGRPVAAEQKPSMGCNIKWKQGNEPVA